MAEWACMITGSHEATEGLAKLLTVTDLYKLKSQVSVAMTEEAELVMQDAWKTMEHLIQASQAQGQKVQERQFQKKFWKAGHQVDFLSKKNWNCIQEILERFSADCQSPSDADTQPQARKVKDFLTDTPATMALLQNRRVNIGQMCLGICFLWHVFFYSAPCASPAFLKLAAILLQFAGSSKLDFPFVFWAGNKTPANSACPWAEALSQLHAGRFM